jgi:hypothetical protein
MPNYSGKFQHLDAKGNPVQVAPCRLTTGPPLAFDLGDIDVFLPGDYELSLTLYTGNKLLLHQFAKAFQDLSHDLLEAYRKRLVQCLLLEDLGQIARFDGVARLEGRERSFTSPAELRLYKSNLAVLPTTASGLQWRLADIDAICFDEATWATVLESEGERITITKLAKRTEEFRQRLEETTSQVRERSARTVRDLFPFLGAGDFQQVALALREGRAAPVAKLAAIDRRTEQALVANVVDAKLKPYFDALMTHLAPGVLHAGFKMMRPDEEDGKNVSSGGAGEMADHTTDAAEPSEGQADGANRNAPAAAEDEAMPMLYWFFFPLVAQPGKRAPANLVAWEATSTSGRATYFFRLVPPERAAQLQDPSQSSALVAEAVRQLNQAIVLLNFRREPIYLPDESLDLQPRFHRYVIARRKIPELGRLRDSFLGRAVHTSPEAWQKQFESYLAQA